MKFGKELMSDPDVQYGKLGVFAKRTSRSDWAEKHEELLRSLAPYPISYDVSQTQSTNFSEYTYTEFLNGLWVSTQSLELNARLFDDASKVNSDISIIETAKEYISDKYISDVVPQKFDNIKKVCFLPGHNMLDVASIELISRLVAEDEEVLFKPHPITNDESLRLIANSTGWHRIIPKEVSGNKLLVNCDEIYTTSASEMAISGTILGKKVINISNFFNEGSGVYHPISRILFIAHKTSIKEAQQYLANIFNCEWTGLLFPWVTDFEKRAKSFFDKSIEYKYQYRSLAYPRGNSQKKKLA